MSESLLSLSDINSSQFLVGESDIHSSDWNDVQVPPPTQPFEIPPPTQLVEPEGDYEIPDFPSEPDTFDGAFAVTTRFENPTVLRIRDPWSEPPSRPRTPHAIKTPFPRITVIRDDSSSESSSSWPSTEAHGKHYMRPNDPRIADNPFDRPIAPSRPGWLRVQRDDNSTSDSDSSLAHVQRQRVIRYDDSSSDTDVPQALVAPEDGSVHSENPASHRDNAWKVRACIWTCTLWEDRGLIHRAVCNFVQDYQPEIDEVYACDDIGEATERPHVHLYVKFKTRKSLSFLQKTFGKGHHYLIVKNPEGAKKYVLGLGEHAETKHVFVNQGPNEADPPKAKKPSLFEQFWKEFKAGPKTLERVDQMLDEEKYYSLILQKRNIKNHVNDTYQLNIKPIPNRTKIWLCGPAGCGKSSLARMIASAFPSISLCQVSAGGQLNGYRPGCTSALFDDLELNNVRSRETLFGWFDNFENQADVKGSSTIINAPLILVTRVEQIQELRAVFEWHVNQIEQLSRRFIQFKCDIKNYNGVMFYEIKDLPDEQYYWKASEILDFVANRLDMEPVESIKEEIKQLDQFNIKDHLQ